MFERIKAYRGLLFDESIMKAIRNYAERHEDEDLLKQCNEILDAVHSEMNRTWFNRILTFICNLKFIKRRL